jgi:dihydrofolate reductase
MIIASIVLTDEKNAIGKNNRLIHHLPAYLKFFQETTFGYPIIMGRKTYESVWHLLPGRHNIIISRHSKYKVEGAQVFQDVKSAIASCDSDKVFIIGGAQIFREAMSFTTEIYHTLIYSQFDSDTFFPEIEESTFDLVHSECCRADEMNQFDYCFQKWERKKNNRPIIPTRKLTSKTI